MRGKALEKDLLFKAKTVSRCSPLRVREFCVLEILERVMREKVKMLSSAGTGFFYTTMKNKRNTPDKLRLKKFDPVVRKHVEFVETKLR